MQVSFLLKRKENLSKVTSQYQLSEEDLEKLSSKRQKKQLEILYKACGAVLKQLMTHKWAWPFNQPVDFKRYPNYLKIIKRPIDLGEVKRKLDQGIYQNSLEFIYEVELVFNNAQCFNPPGSDVFVMADTLKDKFQEKLKQSVIPKLIEEEKSSKMDQVNLQKQLAKEIYQAETSKIDDDLEQIARYTNNNLLKQLRDLQSMAAALSLPLDDQEIKKLLDNFRSLDKIVQCDIISKALNRNGQPLGENEILDSIQLRLMQVAQAQYKQTQELNGFNRLKLPRSWSYDSLISLQQIEKKNLKKDQNKEKQKKYRRSKSMSGIEKQSDQFLNRYKKLTYNNFKILQDKAHPQLWRCQTCKGQLNQALTSPFLCSTCQNNAQKTQKNKINLTRMTSLDQSKQKNQQQFGILSPIPQQTQPIFQYHPPQNKQQQITPQQQQSKSSHKTRNDARLSQDYVPEFLQLQQNLRVKVPSNIYGQEKMSALQSSSRIVDTLTTPPKQRQQSTLRGPVDHSTDHTALNTKHNTQFNTRLEQMSGHLRKSVKGDNIRNMDSIDSSKANKQGRQTNFNTGINLFPQATMPTNPFENEGTSNYFQLLDHIFQLQRGMRNYSTLLKKNSSRKGSQQLTDAEIEQKLLEIESIGMPDILLGGGQKCEFELESSEQQNVQQSLSRARNKISVARQHESEVALYNSDNDHKDEDDQADIVEPTFTGPSGKGKRGASRITKPEQQAKSEIDEKKERWDSERGGGGKDIENLESFPPTSKGQRTKKQSRANLMYDPDFQVLESKSLGESLKQEDQQQADISKLNTASKSSKNFDKKQQGGMQTLDTTSKMQQGQSIQDKVVAAIQEKKYNEQQQQLLQQFKNNFQEQQQLQYMSRQQMQQSQQMQQPSIDTKNNIKTDPYQQQKQSQERLQPIQNDKIQYQAYVNQLQPQPQKLQLFQTFQDKVNQKQNYQYNLQMYKEAQQQSQRAPGVENTQNQVQIQNQNLGQGQSQVKVQERSVDTQSMLRSKKKGTQKSRNTQDSRGSKQQKSKKLDSTVWPHKTSTHYQPSPSLNQLVKKPSKQPSAQGGALAVGQDDLNSKLMDLQWDIDTVNQKQKDGLVDSRQGSDFAYLTGQNVSQSGLPTALKMQNQGEVTQQQQQHQQKQQQQQRRAEQLQHQNSDSQQQFYDALEQNSPPPSARLPFQRSQSWNGEQRNNYADFFSNEIRVTEGGLEWRDAQKSWHQPGEISKLQSLKNGNTNQAPFIVSKVNNSQVINRIPNQSYHNTTEFQGQESLQKGIQTAFDQPVKGTQVQNKQPFQGPSMINKQNLLGQPLTSMDRAMSLPSPKGYVGTLGQSTYMQGMFGHGYEQAPQLGQKRPPTYSPWQYESNAKRLQTEKNKTPTQKLLLQDLPQSKQKLWQKIMDKSQVQVVNKQQNLPEKQNLEPQFQKQQQSATHKQQQIDFQNKQLRSQGSPILINEQSQNSLEKQEELQKLYGAQQQQLQHSLIAQQQRRMQQQQQNHMRDSSKKDNIDIPQPTQHNNQQSQKSKQPIIEWTRRSLEGGALDGKASDIPPERLNSVSRIVVVNNKNGRALPNSVSNYQLKKLENGSKLDITGENTSKSKVELQLQNQTDTISQGSHNVANGQYKEVLEPSKSEKMGGRLRSQKSGTKLEDKSSKRNLSTISKVLQSSRQSISSQSYVNILRGQDTQQKDGIQNVSKQELKLRESKSQQGQSLLEQESEFGDQRLKVSKLSVQTRDQSRTSLHKQEMTGDRSPRRTRRSSDVYGSAQQNGMLPKSQKSGDYRTKASQSVNVSLRREESKLSNSCRSLADSLTLVPLRKCQKIENAGQQLGKKSLTRTLFDGTKLRRKLKWVKINEMDESKGRSEHHVQLNLYQRKTRHRTYKNDVSMRLDHVKLEQTDHT